MLPSLGAEQLHGRSVTVAGNETGIKESNTKKRTKAVSALRLLLGNAEATEMAITALQDPKPQVRAAAATALGLIGSKEAIPALRNAISDKKPVVVLAAARSLQVLNDPFVYHVYYELLSGERKAAEGRVGQQMETLTDATKMSEFGFAFLPFADIGFSAAKARSD